MRIQVVDKIVFPGTVSVVTKLIFVIIPVHVHFVLSERFVPGDICFPSDFSAKGFCALDPVGSRTFVGNLYVIFVGVAVGVVVLFRHFLVLPLLILSDPVPAVRR